MTSRILQARVDILEIECEVKLVSYLHHKIKEKGGESRYNFKNNRY